MPSATIRIAGMEGPKPGKMRGRIKDESGRLFQISTTLAQMVKMGSVYDIDYKDEEFNGANGVIKYRVVENVVPSIGGVPSSTPQRQPQRQTQMAMEPEAAYQDERGTDIATLAIAKEWLDRVPVGDIGAAVHALKAAREAWLKFKASPNIKSPVPESSDYDERE